MLSFLKLFIYTKNDDILLKVKVIQSKTIYLNYLMYFPETC